MDDQVSDDVPNGVYNSATDRLAPAIYESDYKFQGSEVDSDKARLERELELTFLQDVNRDLPAEQEEAWPRITFINMH